MSYVPFLTVSRRYTFRRYSGAPLEAKNALSGARRVAAFGGGGSVPTDRGKRGRRTPAVSYVPS